MTHDQVGLDVIVYELDLYVEEQEELDAYQTQLTVNICPMSFILVRHATRAPVNTGQKHLNLGTFCSLSVIHMDCYLSYLQIMKLGYISYLWNLV